MQDQLSLRQTAALVKLEPMRLYRLGRHLRLAPGDPCIPRTVVVRAQAEADQEIRYRLILDWLLAHIQENTPQRAEADESSGNEAGVPRP